jgi:iron complex transport system permease protein
MMRNTLKSIPILLSLVILLTAPFFGQIEINSLHIFDIRTMDYQIFWDLRFPRVVLAFFVGGILALSGLIFQIVFRNAMSTPFTLGVASGATLFTAIGIILGLGSILTSFVSFIGSLLTIILLFAIGKRFGGNQTTSLLLVGIALSFFYSASLMILFFISNLEESYEIVRFTMGSLDIVGFDTLWLTGFASLLLLSIILKHKKELQIFLTSYEFAVLKGLNVKKVNYILLFTVSICVGICVSITGPIGFVGLIIPHILKIITKKTAHQLIIPIFFYGGIFLVLCDLIARNLGSNSDIPIGVVTSFLGAPFFIYIILKRVK